ncbi:ATP-binding cassette, subfamily B [Pedobacter westerhofensis]|uniref:ATP-binding cassette, subfamily B n=2 Tax=Pedobacter westerhofensis TaxID=425512 RepID=A0A521FSL3_9SPHI|nr:ATP-binding cassette, subfamily B [Pedobacter westerhofensis]
MDCGPTCLRMVAKFYGKNISLQKLRALTSINRDGVSLLGISEAAEKIGLRTRASKIKYATLLQIDLPCIIHWDQNHFVILHRIKGNKHYIADPARGSIVYSKAEFLMHWSGHEKQSYNEGIVMLLSPSPLFFEVEEDKVNELSLTSLLLEYTARYKKLFWQLLLGLLVGSVIQLIIPFLTQSVVDIGINSRNLNFVYVILIAQTALLLGRMSVEFIRSWILLHISTRISISILTDFLIKLMKLPMSFFDTKMTGDIMQRIKDQKRIEDFLTSSTLNTIFSLFNLIVFSILLGYYNSLIFVIFLISTILYTVWVVWFLKKRRDLDYKRFEMNSREQANLIELVEGMQEIKLNNCEKQKRWKWEGIQASIFDFNLKSLAIGQVQQAGAFFINEGKNIVITFIVAKTVIEGDLTLGGMVAIQYIIGQLNSPIEQLLNFIQHMQDAKMSLERMIEVHAIKDEEPISKTFRTILPDNKTIEINNLSFTYPGSENNPVLRNINFNIPEGKTTAIVGLSGSGKTTILKMLLRFYVPEGGEIRVGATKLEQISPKYWRSRCGIVMQEGFIFSDSIVNNIAVGDEYPDEEKLEKAISIANIGDLIDGLPLGIHTKVGAEGNGLSQGQKQRLLIARAVYKDPDYIFFDEATNSLDANNERTIMQNLEEFFKARTVVIVAHRLSTIKNADHIIVLKYGMIVENGNHYSLLEERGDYFELVKNQLDVAL